MGDAIRVNDFGYGYGSLVFQLDDERFYGFTSVQFGEKREHGKGWSMARHMAPYIRSPGLYTPDNLKVTGWRGSVLKLKQGLAAKSSDGRSYGNVIFRGVLQYVEPDQEEITINFDRLVWTANAASHELSADPLKYDFELDVMSLDENGLTLYDASIGAP